MRLGIDFGTTRIVVAAVDRGNYPVISFETSDGDVQDWFPPWVAVSGDQRLYGWDAWHRQDQFDWTVVRSLKRLLSDAGIDTGIEIEGRAFPIQDLLRELAENLKTSLLRHSNLPGASKAEPLQIVLGVPANANTNQRFLTLDAFRQAGFEVLGLLNEPSAAGIEFSHLNRAGRPKADSELLAVYDLGGGTFDVSLVRLDGQTHAVVDTDGIPSLGGDDFDEIMAEMALTEAGLQADGPDALTQSEWGRLLEECRRKKETLHANTRKITIDLELVREGWNQVSVSVPDFYERCEPLIDQTTDVLNALLTRHLDVYSDFRALYVAGGGSEMPLVPRALRRQFSRLVKRAAHARSSTAIGLAIQADVTAGYSVEEKLTRHFGVWREAEGGAEVRFDLIFPRGTPLQGDGDRPQVVTRRYEPAHNIGHFRYLECGGLGDDGRPSGDITLWDEILFPFDPALQDGRTLTSTPVERSPVFAGRRIVESYRCDAGGAFSVSIADETSGYSREYKLAKWAQTKRRVKPGQGKPALKRAKTRKSPDSTTHGLDP
jgi:molecular chaperone DnaK (HSP70)